MCESDGHTYTREEIGTVNFDLTMLEGFFTGFDHPGAAKAVRKVEEIGHIICHPQVEETINESGERTLVPHMMNDIKFLITWLGGFVGGITHPASDKLSAVITELDEVLFAHLFHLVEEEE